MKYIGSKRIAILFAIGFIVLYIVCLSLLVSERISFSFYGFGVDSDNRLYVGWGGKIEVYEDGIKTHTIRRGASKGHFAFTIQENDTILLSMGSDVIVMDLKGDMILKSWTEVNEKTYQMLKSEKYEFRTSEGKLYTAKSNLLGIRIYHEEKEIFKTPVWERIVSYLTFINAPFFVVSVLLLKKFCREH